VNVAGESRPRQTPFFAAQRGVYVMHSGGMHMCALSHTHTHTHTHNHIQTQTHSKKETDTLVACVNRHLIVLLLLFQVLLSVLVVYPHAL